jgi:predicted porin
MKKYLYATTAIVGVGLAATSAQAEEGVKIGLSGFMNTYYGISSRDGGDDSGNTADLDQSHFQDATINFIGSTTLDNGIEVGVRFELESFGHPQDEQFMWFKGSFGEINLGGTNSAGYRMAFAASGNLYTAGVPINTGWVNTFIPAPTNQTTSFRRPSLSTFIDTHNDHNTVSYFSPRISGFQFGASWTPEAVNKNPAAGPNSTANGQFGPVNEDLDYNNALSVGVNYVQSFNGFDVALAGAYNRASAPDNAIVADTTEDDDLQQYMAGINLGYAGFVIGANYAGQDSEDSPGEVANDGDAYSFGVGYTTGPWSLAVNSFFSEVEGSAANNGEDEQTSVVGGIDYALGPGITVSGSILYTDWEEEGGDDLDAVAGIFGTTVTF